MQGGVGLRGRVEGAAHMGHLCITWLLEVDDAEADSAAPRSFPILPRPQVMCAAISPDGTRAATASEDGTLRTWKLDVRYQLQVGWGGQA